jgi:hypothetical protein
MQMILVFNRPTLEAGLLKKNSCLAAASGATKFMTARVMILVTLCCNNSIQQANLSGQSVEKRSCLDAALGVAKFMTARDMIMVTQC